jgi:methyl-accepting chemotaxis protein
MRRLSPVFMRDLLSFSVLGAKRKTRLKGFLDSLLFRIYIFGLVPVIAIFALGIHVLYPKALDFMMVSDEGSRIEIHRNVYSLYMDLIEEQRYSTIYVVSDDNESRSALAEHQRHFKSAITGLEKLYAEQQTEEGWHQGLDKERQLIAGVFQLSERLEHLRFDIKTQKLTDVRVIYESYSAILAQLRHLLETSLEGVDLMHEKRMALTTLMDATYALSSLELDRWVERLGAENNALTAHPETVAKAKILFALLSRTLSQREALYFKLGEKDVQAYLGEGHGISYAQARKELADLSQYMWAQTNLEIYKKQDLLKREFITWSFGLTSLILIMVWFGWMIAARIRKGTSDMISALDGLQRCELSHRCEIYGYDEFSQIAGTFNTVTAHLEGVIEAVRGTSKDLMEETQKVALNSSRMSVSCHDQVQSIGHIQTAMDESSSAVSEANDAAQKATHMIGKMTRNLTEASLSVKDLATNTDEISFVTNSIDEIAGKINLLALNAAIEAARAGDAGRGFAVVADEVRKLAQNASKSNAQIKGAMEKMAENVHDSVSQITGVGTMLGDVEGKVQHLNQTMDTQTDAFGNMVSAIEDFNTRMDTLKSDVDATNSVAGTLSQYAYNMDYQVQVFSLTGDTSAVEEDAPNLDDDDDIDLF